MSLSRVCAVGRAFTNRSFADDQCGLVGTGFGFRDSTVNSRYIMAVDGTDHLPAIGFKARGRVVNKPRRDLSINRDAVVVIQSNQLIELPCPGECTGLMADALHQTAIAQKDVGLMVHHVVTGPVELVSQ